MNVIELEKEQQQDTIERMIASARNGDLILFPTDTVYGLGGMAFSQKVLQKLQKVKPDRPNKPTAVLIDGMIRMSQCAADIPSRKIVALAEAFWPGPLTLVWKTSKAIPEEFQTEDRSLGYRVPACDFLRKVLDTLEAPMWATSANLPGQPAPRIFTEVREAVLSACDLVIQSHELYSGRSSTVVDVRGREPVIVREAAIREDEIRRVWKSA